MFAVAAETAANSIFHMAHGAVLVRSGVILATASNQLGGNRLSPTCPSTHAEIATLARFFGGSVKQCFEKPTEALFCIDKQRPKAGLDPPERRQRVSRPPRQHQQRIRGGWTGPTFVPRPESCVKRAEPRDTGSQKAEAVRLWHQEDTGRSQDQEAMCRGMRYVYC